MRCLFRDHLIYHEDNFDAKSFVGRLKTDYPEFEFQDQYVNDPIWKGYSEVCVMAGGQ